MMFQVMNDREYDANKILLRHSEGIDLIPSNLELSSLENYLVNAMSREKVLERCLRPLRASYDYILIDCIWIS